MGFKWGMTVLLIWAGIWISIWNLECPNSNWDLKWDCWTLSQVAVLHPPHRHRRHHHRHAADQIGEWVRGLVKACSEIGVYSRYSCLVIHCHGPQKRCTRGLFWFCACNVKGLTVQYIFLWAVFIVRWNAIGALVEYIQCSPDIATTIGWSKAKVVKL